MVDCMSDLTKQEINDKQVQPIEYNPKKEMEVPGWI